MRKKSYIIGGASGVGKTSLVRDCVDKTKYKVISTGDLFESAANDVFGLSIDRDSLKHMNWKILEDYVVESLCNIAESIDSSLVVDTHYAVLHSGEFIRGLGRHSIRKFGNSLKKSGYEKCDCILVEAPYNEIKKRVASDSRKRDMNILFDEIEANRKFADDYVSILSGYLPSKKICICNSDYEKAKEKLSDLIGR